MNRLDVNRVLLVHPLGYAADAARGDVSRIANIMPPLGLASIAAYLEGEGVACDIIDCYAQPDSDEAILTYLERKRPGFIGFGCTTSSFLDGVRLAGLSKERLPGILTVFGGPHVSALKERLLDEYPLVDLLVVGEGEATMLEIVKRTGGEIAGLSGICRRDEQGQGLFEGYPDRMLELDELPFPAYEKLAGFPDFYMLPIFNYPTTPNTSCISSRGCPYACSYCDRSVFKKSFRHNSPRYLYDHLAYLKERFGITHVNFYDDQFTFNRARVEEFCGLMVEKPLGMTFNCAVRVEHVDEELLGLMKRAGCWMVSLGIESGDEHLLVRHRQNVDLELVGLRLRQIKRAGLRTKGLFMIGLPGETEESVLKTLDFVLENPIDEINLAKFTPFPGSPIYARAREYGSFDEDWEKMDCMHFVFVPEGMTEERLETLFRDFYRSYFSRTRVLLGYVAMLWKSPDSWRRFAANLFAFLRFARSDRRYYDG